MPMQCWQIEKHHQIALQKITTGRELSEKGCNVSRKGDHDTNCINDQKTDSFFIKKKSRPILQAGLAATLLFSGKTGNKFYEGLGAAC